MNTTLSIVIVLILTSACASFGQNLLKNPGFEERPSPTSAYPTDWMEKHVGSLPLVWSNAHHEGKFSGMIPGDGKAYLWRQNVPSPTAHGYMLSAWVKADNADLSGQGDYASIYGHIIYKNQPYSSATQFYKEIPPGTYGWQKIEVSAQVENNAPIDHIIISINGKLKGGRIWVDDVSLSEDKKLSPQSLLLGKIEDLQKNLGRIGPVDESVAQAQALLKEAAASTQVDMNQAVTHWVSACRAVSHQAWAAMYPQAMGHKPVEAQMVYHGIAQRKADIDAYLSLMQSMHCNGAFLSLGSWMSVIYRSDIIPVEPGWDKFDALSYFIEQAHKRGIKVWGYLAVFYGDSAPPTGPNSIYTLHPDWFAHGPDSNMPIFPDPANPQVIDFWCKAYAELASRYDIDGVGMDNIWYPTPGSLNYDQNNRRQILKRYGIDILAGGDVYKNPSQWSKVNEFRCQQIDNAVHRIHDALKAANPRVSLIGCLSTYPEKARAGYGEDWAYFCKWLDYVSPMNYDEMGLDEAILRKQLEICRKNEAVYISGIGGMPPIHEAWTISDWARRVAIANQVGGDGLIIYRIGNLDQGVAAFFGQGPFYSKATFPTPQK